MALKVKIMVKINKVARRVGDDGRTALGDGARLPKFHVRIAALGSIDEANAFIGLACHYVSKETQQLLEHIQNDLFDVGADLCNPERSGLKVEPMRLHEKQVTWLDEKIEALNAKLKPLTSFVLPNGSLGSVHLHVARAVIRRAEREIVEVAFQAPLTPAIIRYMNRLSDVLFVLARIEHGNKNLELLWRPGENRFQSE